MTGLHVNFVLAPFPEKNPLPTNFKNILPLSSIDQLRPKYNTLSGSMTIIQTPSLPVESSPTATTSLKIQLGHHKRLKRDIMEWSPRNSFSSPRSSSRCSIDTTASSYSSRSLSISSTSSSIIASFSPSFSFSFTLPWKRQPTTPSADDEINVNSTSPQQEREADEIELAEIQPHFVLLDHAAPRATGQVQGGLEKTELPRPRTSSKCRKASAEKPRPRVGLRRESSYAGGGSPGGLFF